MRRPLRRISTHSSGWEALASGERPDSDIQRERCHAVADTSALIRPDRGGRESPRADQGISTSPVMRG